jgi:hypothetical protein
MPVINSLSDFILYGNNSENMACMNTDNQGKIIMDGTKCTKYGGYSSTEYKFVHYFVAQKGEVKFNIENTVNGLAKYNASKDKNLEYKIYVKNIGNASSGENKIITYIPKEVTVIEKDISNDGVFDKSKNTITWEIDRIDVDETLEFTYKAIAPNDVNGKELIGKSSITSTQVLETTYSNNTVVTLDKVIEVVKNPETGTMIYIANTNLGMPLSMFIILIIILCMMTILFFFRMKKERH